MLSANGPADSCHAADRSISEQPGHKELWETLKKLQESSLLSQNPAGVLQSEIAGLNAGAGILPDSASPEQVARELKLLKAKYENRKAWWLARDTKVNFVDKVLGINPRWPSEQEVEAEEKEVEATRISHQRRDAECADMKAGIATLSAEVLSAYNALQKDASTAAQLLRDVETLSAVKTELERTLAHEQDTIARIESEAQAHMAADEDDVTALEREVQELEAALEATNEENARRKKGVVQLTTTRDQAVKKAMEVEDSAKGSDVRADELGEWFKQTFVALSELIELTEVRVRGKNEVDVVFPSRQTQKLWTLHLRLRSGPEGHRVDRYVEASVGGFPVSLDDILDDVNGSQFDALAQPFSAASTGPRRLDDILPRVVHEVTRRVRRWEVRQVEFRKIGKGGRWLVKEEETGSHSEVVVTSASGGMVLTFWLDKDYPLSAACTELIDVKIRNSKDKGTLQKYKELFAKSGAKTIQEMLKAV